MNSKSTPRKPYMNSCSKFLAYCENLFICDFWKKKKQIMSYRCENIIFEVNTPKNPISIDES